MNNTLTATAASPTTGFARAWEAHRERVWRLLVRLTGNRDVADDLTQEVALKAAQAFPQFRGEAQAFTLFYRISVRCALQWRERRWEGMTLQHADQLTAPASDTTTLTAVRTALDTLPSDQRTVLVLAVYEQLSYKEIAAVLEIPLGTVMSRLARARQQLRKELSDVL